mmetsp:Transcript_20507/g.32981  ORF Transcript_20507/g.32981 Transcript_20507/m.32981 type:complete len:204 (-) Transcript_20507:134-745(-)
MSQHEWCSQSAVIPTKEVHPCQIWKSGPWTVFDESSQHRQAYSAFSMTPSGNYLYRLLKCPEYLVDNNGMTFQCLVHTDITRRNSGTHHSCLCSYGSSDSLRKKWRHGLPFDRSAEAPPLRSYTTRVLGTGIHVHARTEVRRILDYKSNSCQSINERRKVPFFDQYHNRSMLPIGLRGSIHSSYFFLLNNENENESFMDMPAE